MFEGSLTIFNPYKKAIEDLGYKQILEHTDKLDSPFLHILGLRWHCAGSNDNNCQIIDKIDPGSSDTILTADFFLPELIKQVGDANSISQLKQKVVVFSDLPNAAIEKPFRPAAMNTYLSDRTGRFNKDLPFDYQEFNRLSPVQIPTVPMGCGQGWLPSSTCLSKTIFLDEPHFSLLDVLDDEGDLRTALFKHALSVCKILGERGFKVVTFSRTKSDKLRELLATHKHIQPISIGDWIPFKSLMDYYADCSLFYSFFTETHGYPIYENMQLGNGVISYAETFDAYTIPQMQNGVLLSIYSKPETCARQVEDFYERYRSVPLRKTIADRSTYKFSCETFVHRARELLSLAL